MTVAALLADARSYTGTLVGSASDAMGDAIDSVRAIGYVIPNFSPVALPNAPPQAISLVLPTQANVDLVLPPEPPSTLVFQDISGVTTGAAPEFNDQPPTLSMPSAPSQIGQFATQPPSLNLSAQFPDAPSLIVPEPPGDTVRAEPTKPSFSLPSFDLVVPVQPTRAEPTAPAISLVQFTGTSPTLTDRAAPTAPQIQLPDFNAQAPAGMDAAPTDLEGRFIRAYRTAAPSTIVMLGGYVDAQLLKLNPSYHEQMGRIEDQLARYLAGGTGIKPEVENAIYSRAREKNEVEAARVRDAAYTDAAKRGFTLPSGALISAVARARQEAANNNLKASSDIVVMQAEMEQKNLQFAVTTSVGLRTAMVSAALAYHQNLIAINGQALDFAKTILSSIIEMYNIAVKAYGVQLEAYKTEASIYETRLKGAMASIELYRAEIAALGALTDTDRLKIDAYRAEADAYVSRLKGAMMPIELYGAQVSAYGALVNADKTRVDAYRAGTDAYSVRLKGAMAPIELYSAEVQAHGTLTATDRNKVEVYKARIDALTAATSLYRTQVEATVSKASLEKLKLDVFQSQVQAYGAQVQAKNAEWQGYSAAIEGETAKVKIFGAQVEAFNARVQSFKVGIDAQSEVVRATAITNQARATQYSATLSGYSAVVQARGDLARTQLENQRQGIVAFQAKTQAEIANAQVRSEYYKATSLVGIENAKLQMSAQIQTADSTRAFGESMARLGTANATIYANLAGAAMSGMNTLAAQTVAE